MSQAVHLTPDDHAGKPRYLNNLGTSFLSRFDNSGGAVDIDQAIAARHNKQSICTADGHVKQACLAD